MTLDVEPINHSSIIVSVWESRGICDIVLKNINSKLASYTDIVKSFAKKG